MLVPALVLLAARTSPLKPIEAGWKRGETIVVKVEEIGEAFDFSQRFGQRREPVVPQVQHAQMPQPADLFGDFAEIIVREDQRFEIRAIPHRFRDSAEPLLPKIEVSG